MITQSLKSWRAVIPMWSAMYLIQDFTSRCVEHGSVLSVNATQINTIEDYWLVELHMRPCVTEVLYFDVHLEPHTFQLYEPLAKDEFQAILSMYDFEEFEQ